MRGPQEKKTSGGRFTFLEPPPSPGRLIICLGLVLAVALTILRAVILWSEISDLGGLGRLNAVLQAGLQDWIVVLGLTVVALVHLSLLNRVGSRYHRRALYLYSSLFGLFLLVGLANVPAVRMLGEPVTRSWLIYADIFNSSYIFDSVFHVVTPGRLALTLAILAGFFALSFLLARLSERRWGKAGFVVMLPILSGVFGFSLLNGGAVEGIDDGKTSNAAVALVASFLTDKIGEDSFVSQPGNETLSLFDLFGAVDGARRPDVATGDIRNVVLFSLESTPAKYVEGFDSAHSLTPNIRRFSEIGHRFTRSYIHVPASNYFLVSAVAGIVPELSPHGMTYTYPELQLAGLASILSERGSRTAFFNSADNRFQNTVGFAEANGFDTVKDYRDWPCELGMFESEFDPSQYLNTSHEFCMIPPILDWIDEDRNAPFFLMARTGMTHYPYFAGSDPQDYVEDAAHNRYLNAIRIMDEAFGKLMDGLVQRGLLESTLVVVVGDHGEAFGEHGHYGHATALFEENIHVPLILMNPTLFSGQQADVINGTADLAPTIFDLMGIQQPRTWQGTSLFAPRRPNGVMFFAPWKGFKVGFRTAGRKYVYNASTGEEWLFDLETDPEERVNMAKRNAAVTSAAKATLASLIAIQNARMARLVSGQHAPREEFRKGPTELVVWATGTSYMAAPRGAVSLDGVLVGTFDVENAPSNGDALASDEAVDRAVSKFQIPVASAECAKRVEIRFLNDEWEGEGQTGDTDLFIERVELAGRNYYPKDFNLLTENAGKRRRQYFALFREGSLSVNLDLPVHCLAAGLASE